MGFLFPDPPTPPNPILTAGAQTAPNIGTAITGSYLNNYNQVTPQGNLTYDVTGNYAYNDPLTGQVYNIPRWTATQTLSPIDEQTIAEPDDRAAYNQAELGKDLSHNLWNIAAAPTMHLQDVYNNAPRAGTVPGAGHSRHAVRLGATSAGSSATSAIRASSNPPSATPATSPAATARRTTSPPTGSGSSSRCSSGWTRNCSRTASGCASSSPTRASSYGTEAYDRAIAAADRQTTDARLAVTAAGGAEQQRMNDMAAQRAGFQNAAQKQAYDQALGRGTFANQAQLEQFQKNLQSGNFANQAQKDAFTQAASRAQFANAAQAQELARQQVGVQRAERRSRAST